MLLGLTGGIAAGKSTVAGMLRELGAAVLDADQLARQVVERDPALRQRLAAEFGDGVLAADGSLDRQQLGRLVFADAGARRRLEALTHPAIAAEAERRVAELREVEGAAIVVYEAALLVETGRHRQMDRLLVVVADDELRVRRLMRRSGLSEAQARQRLASQLPQEQKARQAHYVVDNSGSLDHTRRRVWQVWSELTRYLEDQ
jgi:dephospho-CoA kinase